MKGKGYQRAPLLFWGQKLKWWRELKALAGALPRGACVLDAFGGSLSVARVFKDVRPDLTVVTNDYGMNYRQRLCCADETAAALAELQALVPKRQCHDIYHRLPSELTEQAIAIVEGCKDKATTWSWLYKKSTLRNKVPLTSCIDLGACKDWTKGLLVIDEFLCAGKARFFAEAGAYIILDPPYHGYSERNPVLSACYEKAYSDDAQAFCAEAMRQAEHWCLFEKPSSPLANLARELGAREVQRIGKENRSCVNDVLFVKGWQGFEQGRNFDDSKNECDSPPMRSDQGAC